MTPVRFGNVGYSIGGRQILEDVTFGVDPGETVVLLGRSGSGKTTALKMVNALLWPTRGEVLVDGRATPKWDPIALRRGIGYVIQDVGLFPHFTIAQNVGLVPQLAGWVPKRIAARVEELLLLVGLEPRDFASRFPRQLSGGQRQRVGVARALAGDPPILLFDEPFGALDPVTRRELQDQFLKLQRDLHKTSIFVTHDVREAMRLGTRVLVLNRGRLEPFDSSSAEARAFLACLED
jgi:osmoprotectant transport system ATP-binding protein